MQDVVTSHWFIPCWGSHVGQSGSGVGVAVLEVVVVKVVGVVDVLEVDVSVVVGSVVVDGSVVVGLVLMPDVVDVAVTAHSVI